ncbi:MAG: putative rane protein [Gemmatimonadetes bacterium]|nr:putative rane protein [Gemmatimonadota bacterium]
MIPSLLILLIKATIILVAALGITLAMQRTSAGARHLVWLVTLVTLLLVPALTAWAPIPLRILPAAQPAAAVPKVHRTSPDLGSPSASDVGIAVASQSAVSQSPAAPAPGMLQRAMRVVASAGLVKLALIAWGAVLALILLTLAWAGLTVRRLVRQATPLDTADWTAPLFEVSDRLGLDEPPRLLRSEEARMPFACGLVTPTIVFPAECDNWSLDRRHAVLLHELAHVRRRDLVGHTLGRLACAVYWFHPLVWTAARQLRNESERACDDLALSCGTRAADYAEHLLDIVTSVRRDATPLVALAMARRKEFEGRMLAILDPELRRTAPSRRQSAALIATLACIALVVGAAAPAPRVASAASVNESAPVAQLPEASPAPKPKAEPRPTSPSLDAPLSTDFESKAQVKVNTQVQLHSQEYTNERISEKVAENPRLQKVIDDLLNGDKGDKGPKGGKGAKDDRPVLLAKILRTDTSATLRRIAAWGLEEYADAPVAAEALATALRKDADDRVREMAAWALGSGDESPAALDALAFALKGDANIRVRALSAWALGSIGDRAGVDALVGALDDPSPEVRMRATWAIGSVEPKQAPKQVIAMLEDKDPRLRRLAAWVLYTVEDASAVPALEAALKREQDRDLQLSYIRALAALGEKSVDAIKGLLDSNDPAIKSMAVRALAGGHATGPWPWPWPEPRPFP